MPTAQFSYCLITDAVSNPNLAGSVVFTNSSGLLNVNVLGSASSGLPLYYVNSISGSMTFLNGSSYPLSVLAMNTYDSNPNTFTVAAANRHCPQ